MTEHERALCAATASLLRASGTVALAGFSLSCIALAVLALTSRSLAAVSCMAFGAVAVIGLLERYLALRLRLDAGLYDGLARGTISALSTLDRAVQGLGLRHAPDTPRPLAERVRLTRDLLQRHGIAVGCQAAMFLLALLTQDLR